MTLSDQTSRKRENSILPVPVPANGGVPLCAVWYGGSPVSLDGAQAEKAIPGSADAGTKLNSTW